MPRKKGSDYTLQELYDIYEKLDPEEFPRESKMIYEEILIMEKLSKSPVKEINLASLSDRIAAALIDWIIISILIILLISLTGDYKGFVDFALQGRLNYSAIMFMIWQVLYLWFNGRLLQKYGQTIGKKFMKIKIVNFHDELPWFHNSYVMRYFIFSIYLLIPILGLIISFLDILFIFRKDRRCIHDHISGTKVVNIV